jgi:hypothetical protein
MVKREELVGSGGSCRNLKGFNVSGTIVVILVKKRRLLFSRLFSNRKKKKSNNKAVVCWFILSRDARCVSVCEMEVRRLFLETKISYCKLKNLFWNYVRNLS